MYTNENSINQNQHLRSHSESLQPTMPPVSVISDTKFCDRTSNLKSSCLVVDDIQGDQPSLDNEQDILDSSGQHSSGDIDADHHSGGASPRRFFSDFQSDPNLQGGYTYTGNLPTDIQGGFGPPPLSRNVNSDRLTEGNSRHSIHLGNFNYSQQPGVPLHVGNTLFYQQHQQQMMSASIQSAMGPVMSQINDFCSASKQSLSEHRAQIIETQNQHRVLLERQLSNQQDQIAGLRTLVDDLARPPQSPVFVPNSPGEVELVDEVDYDDVVYSDDEDDEVRSLHSQQGDVEAMQVEDSPPSIVDLSSVLLTKSSSPVLVLRLR